MQITNITTGQNFANYKALCEALKVPSTGGKVKELTLKKMESFFTWKREGNSYIITEILSQDSQITNIISALPHRKLCELLLIDYFRQQLEATLQFADFQNNRDDCYELILTKAQINPLVGLVNNVFSTIKNGKSEKFDCKFATDVRAKNWEIIKDVLWSLNKNNLILNYKSFLVLDGKQAGVRILSVEEAAKVAQVYQEILQEMGRKDIAEIYRRGELQGYFKKLHTALQERYKISYHEECFVFKVYPSVVKGYLINRVQLLNKLPEVKIEVNSRHIENLFEFFKKQFMKFRGLQETDYMGMQTEHYDRLEDNYLERNAENINKYVKIN